MAHGVRSTGTSALIAEPMSLIAFCRELHLQSTHVISRLTITTYKPVPMRASVRRKLYHAMLA